MDHEQPGAQRRCPWQRLPGTGGYHSALRTPFAARTRNVALGLALVAGSSLAPACASTHASSTLPEPGIYAPPEVTQPYIPSGTPVDPSGASELSLDQLLVFADAYSPAVQSARARVGLADAEVIGAEIVFPANPQLSFGAGGRTIEGATGFEFEVAVQQRI